MKELEAFQLAARRPEVAAQLRLQLLRLPEAFKTHTYEVIGWSLSMVKMSRSLIAYIPIIHFYLSAF